MLKNDKAAEELIQQYQPGKYAGETLFYNALAIDAQYISILTEYFPERLKSQSDLILNLANNLSTSQFNSLSVAYTARALSAYASLQKQTNPDYELVLSQILGDKTRKILSQKSLEKPIAFDAAAKTFQLELSSKQNVFYQLVQAGFDKTLNDQPIKQGIEIYREYQDLAGKKITQAKLGEEIQVEISIRSLNNQAISNVAIVDLLPAGFELETNSLSQNTWLDYYDAREDRVIFYGSVTKDIQKIIYRMRAINQGEYTIPAAYAAAMYDASLYGLAPSGKIKVGKY